MPDLVALLTNAGLRVTPQRLTLLELLRSEGGHLTADELYQRARLALPRLSATSLYKSLHTLCQTGLVREVHVEAGRVRFEVNGRRQHHHRVCQACGRVEDVACPSSASGACVPEHDFGAFRVEQVEVVYRGLCGDCQAPGRVAPGVLAEREKADDQPGR